MNNYKKFSGIIVTFLFIFIVFHAVVWHTLTKKVVLIDDMIYNGDLGRFAFKQDSLYPRPTYLVEDNIQLEKKHFNFNNIKNRKIDIITIGDSFSNAATQGMNPFYQDYIATYNNLNVLNIIPTLGFIETINIINNNKIIDDLNPNIIIIESLENFCIPRFANKINFKQTKNMNDVISIFNSQQNVYLKKDENIKFINNKNIKAVKYLFQRSFVSQYGKFGKVFSEKLQFNMFSVVDADNLLFWHDDINNIQSTNLNKIKILNSNFNILAKELKKKGIKLYFMPVVSKYNLYSKYIVNNRYPQSRFFELLRELPKEYEFIDTKKILRTELEKGVKDLYYPDDTHWSYKASEAIFRKVKFD